MFSWSDQIKLVTVLDASHKEIADKASAIVTAKWEIRK